MVSDRAYLRLFQPDRYALTKPEIKRLLDEELTKNDPDTDLIGYCLDALDEMNRTTRAPLKIKRFSAKTAAALAAVFLILLCSMTASAAFLDIDLFDPLVKLYNDRIRIGHNGGSTEEEYALSGTDLAKTLAENGITPVLLPKALTDGTYTVDSVQYETTELIKSANIRFSSEKTAGTLVINVYADGAALPVTDYGEAKDAAALQTDRITCYIFTQADHTVIDFSDGRTVYSVIMNCSREEAVALAQSIQ